MRKEIRWEYKVVEIKPSEEERELNLIGLDIWELIAINFRSEMKTNVFYFKKKIDLIII